MMSNENINDSGAKHNGDFDNKGAAGITTVLNLIAVKFVHESETMSLLLCLMPFLGAILYSHLAKYESLLKAESRELVIYKKQLKTAIKKLKKVHSEEQDDQVKKEIEKEIIAKKIDLCKASSDYTCGKLDLSHIA